jgi:error-prone DNA polymerase
LDEKSFGKPVPEDIPCLPPVISLLVPGYDIERLELAGYFLIVWDIMRYCNQQNILIQGRGSAANDVVCYGLGITAIDPVGMELLFERLLSEERELPDIDLDLPSGDEREKANQY